MKRFPIRHLVICCCLHVCYVIGFRSQASPPRLKRQSSSTSCNAAGSDWQPDPQAFNDADTFTNLVQWNQNRQPPDERFDRAIGAEFGNDDFLCGLGQGLCVSGIVCSDVPPWLYQVVNSMVNFDSLLNNVYEGINVAQDDATDLTPTLADQLFKWKDPNWLLEDILQWVGLALGIVFSFGAGQVANTAISFGLGAASTRLSHDAFEGAGVIAGALPPQVADELQTDLPRQVGIDKLNSIFYQTSKRARGILEIYANNTFAGLPDANNKTIIDILGHGTYVTQLNIPSKLIIETFYLDLLVAKAINSWWRQQPVYIVSTTADLNGSTIDYPKNASWYSPQTGRTYIPYYYHGHKAQEPPGLASLNGSLFGIQTSQVAQAAGRAWEVAGFNYSSKVASERIQAAFASNGSLTPFQDGAGWEGIFNIGVCDIQDHKDWIGQYGSGLLPCCCGVGCNETRAFVESVNLNKSSAWRHACFQQLKATNIDPSTIDYGIDDRSKAARFWHSLGLGHKVGFVIFNILAFVALMLSFVGCAFRSNACVWITLLIVGGGSLSGVILFSIHI